MVRHLNHHRRNHRDLRNPAHRVSLLHPFRIHGTFPTWSIHYEDLSSTTLALAMLRLVISRSLRLSIIQDAHTFLKSQRKTAKLLHNMKLDRSECRTRQLLAHLHVALIHTPSLPPMSGLPPEGVPRLQDHLMARTEWAWLNLVHHACIRLQRRNLWSLNLQEQQGSSRWDLHHALSLPLHLRLHRKLWLQTKSKHARHATGHTLGNASLFAATAAKDIKTHATTAMSALSGTSVNVVTARSATRRITRNVVSAQDAIHGMSAGAISAKHVRRDTGTEVFVLS